MKSRLNSKAFALTNEQLLQVSGGNGLGVEPPKAREEDQATTPENQTAISLKAIGVNPDGNGSGNKTTNP